MAKQEAKTRESIFIFLLRMTKGGCRGHLTIERAWNKRLKHFMDPEVEGKVRGKG